MPGSNGLIEIVWWLHYQLRYKCNNLSIFILQSLKSFQLFDIKGNSTDANINLNTIIPTFNAFRIDKKIIAFSKSENIKYVLSLIYTKGGEGNVKTTSLYQTRNFAITIIRQLLKVESIKKKNIVFLYRNT